MFQYYARPCLFVLTSGLDPSHPQQAIAALNWTQLKVPAAKKIYKQETLRKKKQFLFSNRGVLRSF